ncbi:hypothetical protein D9M72_402250 [compost metagenome]
MPGHSFSGSVLRAELFQHVGLYRAVLLKLACGQDQFLAGEKFPDPGFFILARADCGFEQRCFRDRKQDGPGGRGGIEPGLRKRLVQLLAGIPGALPGLFEAAPRGVCSFQERRGFIEGAQAAAECRVARTQFAQCVIQGVRLFLDFHEGGLSLRHAGIGCGPSRFRSSDVFVQFCPALAAGGEVSGRPDCLVRPLLRPGRVRARFLRREIAALGRQHGDLLPRFGKFFVQRCQDRFRSLAGFLSRAFRVSNGQRGRGRRSRTRVLGAAAHGAGLRRPQLGSKLRSCIGEPLFPQVQPPLAVVLVVVPGQAVPFGNAGTDPDRCSVAADDGDEFLRGCGLLGPQLGFGSEFLEGLHAR